MINQSDTATFCRTNRLRSFDQSIVSLGGFTTSLQLIYAPFCNIILPEWTHVEFTNSLQMIHNCIITTVIFTSFVSEINECSENTDDCGQLCINTAGSYTCSCNSGYRLASNGRTCNG